MVLQRSAGQGRASEGRAAAASVTGACALPPVRRDDARAKPRAAEATQRSRSTGDCPGANCCHHRPHLPWPEVAPPGSCRLGDGEARAECSSAHTQRLLAESWGEALPRCSPDTPVAPRRELGARPSRSAPLTTPGWATSGRGMGRPVTVCPLIPASRPTEASNTAPPGQGRPWSSSRGRTDRGRSGALASLLGSRCRWSCPGSRPHSGSQTGPTRPRWGAGVPPSQPRCHHRALLGDTVPVEGTWGSTATLEFPRRVL